MPTQKELTMLQSLPLEIKQAKSMARIDEWVRFYGEDNVCVAFSGSKDSTVLLHLVRKRYPNVRAVFSDTGLEYPEIREFVKSVPNVDWVKPKQTFREITIEHGYPLFSKEVAETIRFARKIVGGGQLVCSEKDYLERNDTSKTCLVRQTNCRRKKLQGVFRWATGREQVNF
jgi:3'-phosphoadenosine 5'-phosphosulfate sulfotransferase (PAPS reductase)/FAD synthetase